MAHYLVSLIMKQLLILYVIAIISAEGAKENTPKCEGVHVRNKFHKKEVLGMGLNRPYQLSYDHSDNRVYFSQNIGKDEEDSFEIGYLVKGHHQHKAIKSVENGFATAIDNKNGVLYLGGSKGIFKKDLKINGSEVEKVISRHNVWDMFFKEHLYFISYPSQHLYKVIIKDGKHIAERQRKFLDKLYQFAIDGDNDTFVTEEAGFFMIGKKTEDRIGFGDDAPTVYRALEINNKGHAYVTAQHAIYFPRKSNHTLEKVADIKDIFGITFDNDDNIIYSTPTEIVRLLPEECK